MSALAYDSIDAANDFTLYTVQDEPITVSIDENVEDGLLTFSAGTRTIQNTAIGSSYLYYLSQS